MSVPVLSECQLPPASVASIKQLNLTQDLKILKNGQEVNMLEHLDFFDDSILLAGETVAGYPEHLSPGFPTDRSRRQHTINSIHPKSVTDMFPSPLDCWIHLTMVHTNKQHTKTTFS